MIKGYKFFNEGFKSKYGIMPVGKIYYYDGEIKLCKLGFHFSKKLTDAFSCCYENAKHCCIVEGSGKIIEGDDKIACSEIYIKEELDFNNVLRKLSDNKEWYVRAKVAQNKNCSEDILRRLSNDENYYVRKIIANNNNCPIDIFRKFLNDNDCSIRQTAIDKLKEKN